MKIRSLFSASLLISSLIVCASAQATVYHLICRGSASGNTSMTVRTLPSDDGTLEAQIQYRFERFAGAKADIRKDGSHLAPGQCSWATGLLTAKQGFFTHTISNPQTYFQFSFDPKRDKNGIFQPGNPRVAVGSDLWDPAQAYIPNLYNNSPDPQGEGTIADQDMIFHFYMALDPDGYLEFYSLNSAVKLY